METKEPATRPVKKHLSSRQEEALKFIVDYVRKNGYAPGLRDIGGHLSKKHGLTGGASYAKQIVDALIYKGYLRRGAGKARAIVVVREE
jgi:SOS-response transcriptional repressor LexA